MELGGAGSTGAFPRMREPGGRDHAAGGRLHLVLRRRARVDHGHARNPGDSRSGKPDNVGFVFFSDPDGNAWAENPARRRGLRLASGRYLLHGARLGRLKFRAQDEPNEPVRQMEDRWMDQGNAGRAAVRIDAADTYEWLPGGFGLLHVVDANVGDEKIEGAEIIGYDAARGV